MSHSDQSSSQGDSDMDLSSYEDTSSEYSSGDDTSSSESEYLTSGSTVGNDMAPMVTPGPYPNVGGSNEAGTSSSWKGKAPIEDSSNDATFTTLLERISRNTSQQTRDYLTPPTMPNPLHSMPSSSSPQGIGSNTSYGAGIGAFLSSDFSSIAGPSSFLPENNNIPTAQSYCPIHGPMPPLIYLEQYPHVSYPPQLWNDYSGTDTSFCPIFHSTWLPPPLPNTSFLPPPPNIPFLPLPSPPSSPWGSGLAAGHNQQGVTQIHSDPTPELSLPTHRDPCVIESQISRGRNWMLSQALRINDNDRGISLRLPTTISQGDRFDGMRLEIDDMSYEELLDLEDQIGQVGTGLNEMEIGVYLRRRTIGSSSTGAYLQAEPCCICRELYVADDEVGMLDCKHEFHAACIKEWLKRQNKCPICRKKGLDCYRG